MAKNKDKWSALSMKDRADLIKLYVSNGVTSLNDIKRDYNSFGGGGNTERVKILDGTEDEQTLSGIPPEEELYQDTILPTINLEDYNRRELRRFAREVANRQEQNSIYGPTFQEVLNDEVLYNSKYSRQEERFKRLVNRQYRRNVRHTEQMARIKAAAAGDIKAFQDYITTGTNAVAPYFIPLVAGPAAGAAAGAGVFPALGEMLSAPAVRWPLEALGFGDFVYNNFFTDNGFKKTIKRFNEGDFWGTLGSGFVDVLDLSGTLGAGFDLLKLAKPNIVKSLSTGFSNAKNKINKAKTLLQPMKKVKKVRDLKLKNTELDMDLQDLQENLSNQVLKLKPELYAGVEMAGDKNFIPEIVSTTQYKLPDGQTIPIETVIKNPTVAEGYYPKRISTEAPLQKVAKADPNGILYVGPGAERSNTALVSNVPVSGAVNNAFSEYVSGVQSTMGNSGIVGGSSVLYTKGYISGVPNDLEIITTASRKQDLYKKIGFDDSKIITKPMAIESTSKVAGGSGKTEIQVIEEDPQGYAKGKLAHELYRILYPTEHAELISKTALNSRGSLEGSASLLLPKSSGGYYTANELLDEFLATKGAMTKKTLIDAFSTSKMAGYSGTKLSRPVGILYNTDPVLQDEVLDAITTMGKMNLGKDFKTVKELYPNIDYSDVAANEAFLKSIGFDTSLASNPKAMENITEYYHMQLSASHRSFHDAESPKDFVTFAHSTNAPKGGTASGAGGNSLIGGDSGIVGYSQVSMSQYPVVIDGNSVNSPIDILNGFRAQRPHTVLSKHYSPQQIESLKALGIPIDESSTLKDVDNYLVKMNREALTEKVGDILGIQGVFGSDYYGTAANYFGRYSKNSIADSYRIVNYGEGPQLDYEMGRLLDSYRGLSGSATNTQYDNFRKSIIRTLEDFTKGRITSRAGFELAVEDMDTFKKLQRELKDVDSRRTVAHERERTLRQKEEELITIATKIDNILKRTLKTSVVGAGVVVGSVLGGKAIKENMEDDIINDYSISYQSTPQFKDDYYPKILKSVYQDGVSRDYYPEEHWLEAKSEMDENILNYAKGIRKAERKEKRQKVKK